MPHDFSGEANENFAWAQIRRKRLCPDMSILLSKSAIAEKHLEHCAWCRERLEIYNDFPFDANQFEAPSLTVPKPGELRRITDIDPCVEDLIYNPPMVLVLTEADPEYGFLRVAQVFDEPALAAKGDVPLDIASGEYFAESWNTYPLLPKFLAPCLGTASKKSVEDILALADEPLPDVPPDSPIEAFREMEIEIGYHFNQESYNQSLQVIEDEVLDDPQTSSAHIARDVEQINNSAKIIPFNKNAELPKKGDSQSKDDANLKNASGHLSGMAVSPPLAYLKHATDGPAKGKTRPFLKKFVAPFSIAACLCIMTAAVWHYLSSPDVSPDKRPIAKSFSQSSMAPKAPSERTNASNMDFSLLFSLLAQGGVDTTRGEADPYSLPWENAENIKPVSDSWKAFAAGQWEARNKIANSRTPFPQNWLKDPGDSPKAWSANPYYNLGILAFAADRTCEASAKPKEALENVLAGIAATLAGQIRDSDKTVTDFLRTLTESPLSCSRVGDYLDEFDKQY